MTRKKGWTLLNRGVVIGSIRFNIEELIRGIAEIDCSELYRQKETKRQDLLKYKQMFSVSKYQETIDSESNNLAGESYNSLIDSKINQCKMRHNLLKKELSRIDKVLKENKHFRNFIGEIGLLVKTPNGDTIAVTENNIVGIYRRSSNAAYDRSLNVERPWLLDLRTEGFFDRYSKQWHPKHT